MSETQTPNPTPAPAQFRNGILVFAGGMALAAASFIAEHYFMKVARKVEDSL